MKTLSALVVFGVVPLTFACTKKQTTAEVKPNSDPPSLQAAIVPMKQIMGVVQFQEKCSEPKIESSCLMITGGEDLNASHTFYLPGASPSPENPEKFRVETRENPVEVSNHQHVAMLAEVTPASSEGEGVISSVRSFEVIEK